MLLDDEERAMGIILTVSEIHSKVPDMLGTWNEPAVYMTCYGSSAFIQKYQSHYTYLYMRRTHRPLLQA